MKLRSLSSILFYLTRAIASVYGLIVSYAVLVFTMHLVWPDAAPLAVADGRFEIFYPFTSKVFLLGEMDATYLMQMLGLMTLYAVFFWLLGNVFLTFRQITLFTPKGVRRLNLFWLYSITAPVLSIVSLTILNEIEPAAQLISILHIIIGIFAYFMAAIFKQGLKLQVQQEFTI